MKLFGQLEYREAMNVADKGGEALHVFVREKTTIKVDEKTGKKRSYTQEVELAHLYDNVIDRLRVTALALGIEDPDVKREGLRGQHVLLTKKTEIRKALELVAPPEPPVLNVRGA